MLCRLTKKRLGYSKFLPTTATVETTLSGEHPSSSVSKRLTYGVQAPTNWAVLLHRWEHNRRGGPCGSNASDTPSTLCKQCDCCCRLGHIEIAGQVEISCLAVTDGGDILASADGGLPTPTNPFSMIFLWSPATRQPTREITTKHAAGTTANAGLPACL